MSWKTQQFNPSPQNNKIRVSSTKFSNHHQVFNGNESPISIKQNNLSNTAVLRMLNENQSTAKKEVVWPPPAEETDILEESYKNNKIDPNSQNSRLHFQPRSPSRNFEPPPTYIPLRSSPPVQQEAPPVYKSQPVTDSYRGGAKMRGDQRWPPPEYKEQIEAENKANMELARGPLFRPLKVQKDYRPFFAKNSIPNTYPTYKAPPGTQHYLSDSDNIHK